MRWKPEAIARRNRTRYKVLKMQAADWALVCGAVLLLITMIVLAYVL